ncbi:MAG: hypothetical protein AN484_21010 [Aphanizomenon flos-aquae WA102]|jgi:hypothetical protein|uniref:Uncharacterized protein n=1 Tax=Aphanizomenon flos-aquae WA102 TaxID=1710896 RepID=A0A1B7WWB8_APHFL|nr:MAG: hypothetical protein AN484_21010 [Aphanizomenon flos-aquae WA102]
MNNETASNCLAEILEAIDEGAAPNVVGATAIANRDAIRKAVKTLKPKSRPRESNEDEDYFYY